MCVELVGQDAPDIDILRVDVIETIPRRHEVYPGNESCNTDGCCVTPYHAAPLLMSLDSTTTDTDRYRDSQQRTDVPISF